MSTQQSNDHVSKVKSNQRSKVKDLK